MLFPGNAVVVFLQLAMILALVFLAVRKLRSARARVDAAEHPTAVPARVD